MVFKGEFIGSLVDPGIKALGRLGASHFEAAAQFVNGGGLDEQGEEQTGVSFLEMDGSFYLDIQQGNLSCMPDAFQLALQGAIIFPLVDHLPFRKFIVLDLLLECLQAEEIIVDPVLFMGAGGTGGGGDGESQLWVFRQ